MMDFLKNLKSSDSSSKKSSLHDERIAKQKKTYTKWVNNVLQDHGSRHRVKDLYNDLRSGIILADIVRAFTDVKLKVNSPSSPDDKVIMSSNLSLVLESMRNDGVDLVNNNIADIYDGKAKIVLGLIWQIILHYDIRRSIQHHQDLSYSDPDQSFSSLENGSVKSLKSSPTSKIKNVVMSPIASYKKRKEKKKKTIERGQCSKIILTWLTREICIPYGIKISNFSSDWKDGVAFMALIHKFCPSLIDMEIVRRSPPHVNISCAFRYASECFGIKNILEVEDILCDSPEDSSITLYVSQFMKMDKLEVENEKNKVSEKSNDKVGVLEEMSSSNENTSSSPNNSAVVTEKVIVREEKVEEEICTKQYTIAGGPLSTVSEESYDDASIDSYQAVNSCKQRNDVVYGDHSDYQMEFVREPVDSSILSSATNDSVFERSNISKNGKVKEGELLFTEDNNLPSPHDVIESYNRGLENIFSSIFGDGAQQDIGNTSNYHDVESATSYVKQLTSSVGVVIDEGNDTSVSSQSSEEGDIECCLDEIPLSRNKSFFDDSQESSSTSGTVVQSITSNNLDVVETVEFLIETVVALLEIEIEMEPEDFGVTNDNINKNVVDIVYESDNENFGDCVDESLFLVGKEDEAISEDTLNKKEEIEKEESIIIQKGQDINLCSDDLCENPSSLLKKENGNFLLKPWWISPLEKVYEMMNDSGPGECIEGCSISLKARSLQDCDGEETVDTTCLQKTSDITFDLNGSLIEDSSCSVDPVIVENYEDVGKEDDSMVDSLLNDVNNLRELVDDMASKVQLVSGGFDNEHPDFNDKFDGELMSSNFSEKTIEDQIKDIAEAVETLSTAYIGKLQEVEGRSGSEKSDEQSSLHEMENSTDTETPYDEYADISSMNSTDIINVYPEYSGDNMNNNIVTGSLFDKNTTLRKRLTTSNEGEGPSCNLSDDVLEDDNSIMDKISKISTSMIKSISKISRSYGFIIFLFFIIILVGLAYLIYDCSTCSGNCRSTYSSLCCAPIGMHIHKLRGHVPF